MTTVPTSDSPPPADNHIVHTVSDPMSHSYGRPIAGGNVVSGTAEGGVGAVGAGQISGYAINWNGAPVGVGTSGTGADIGAGATIIASQPDATGHPAGDASGGGTVGDSGPQGSGPAPIPQVSGLPDIDNDGDAL